MIIIYWYKISYEDHSNPSNLTCTIPAYIIQKTNRINIDFLALGNQGRLLAGFGNHLGSILRSTSQTQIAYKEHSGSCALWVVHCSFSLHNLCSRGASKIVLLMLYKLSLTSI